jgi:hypothetical protein
MLRVVVVILAQFTLETLSKNVMANQTVMQDSLEKWTDKLVSRALEARLPSHSHLDTTVLAKIRSDMSGARGGLATMHAPRGGLATMHVPSRQPAMLSFRLNSLSNTESSASYLRGRKYLRTALGHRVANKKIKWPASRIRYEKDNKNIFLSDQDVSEELSALSPTYLEAEEADHHASRN